MNITFKGTKSGTLHDHVMILSDANESEEYRKIIDLAAQAASSTPIRYQHMTSSTSAKISSFSTHKKESLVFFLTAAVSDHSTRQPVRKTDQRHVPHIVNTAKLPKPTRDLDIDSETDHPGPFERGCGYCGSINSAATAAAAAAAAAGYRQHKAFGPTNVALCTCL